ncbi:MAG: hypothetical protein Q7S30_03310 [Candidatus Omnitrophota bacterium]|nr:hypothetical protein [Candidatus Omnitrophota bacterium]
MLSQKLESLDDKVFNNILRSPHVNAAADSALAKAFTKDNLLKLLKPGSGFSIKLIQPKDEVEGVRIPAIIITSSGSNYGHYSTKHDCAYLPWGLIDMLLDLKVSEPKIVGDALHEMAEYLIVKQAFPGKTVVEKISGDVEESRAHYAAQLLEIAVSGATTRDKEAIMGPRSALDDLLEDVTEDYLNKLKGEGIDNAHACFNSDAFIRYSGEQINHRVGRLHKKIEKLIHEYRDIDALLAAERHKEKQDAAKQSELEIKLSAKEAEINKIIDEVNKFTKVASDKFNTSAPLTVSVDEKDKEAARALIIKGGYVPQFLFAGAADRLNQKLPSELRAPMCMQYSWPITRACIENFIRYYKKARDAFNSSSGEKQSKASADQRKWLELLNNTLLALGKPEVTGEKVMKINDKWVDSLIPKDAIEGLTIGAKQLINFRLQLEELAGPESAAEVIKRQKIILHVNAESEDHVTRDLIANNFYGFEHQNIFIVSQPEFHGFDIVKGKAVYVENSRALPAGHGYVTQQVAIPDQAYYIITDAAKGKTPVKIGLRLYKYLEDLGCKLVDTYRINDLEKYSYNTLDLDSIAMSMKLIKRNKNLAVVELVGNPDMQKGGNFFTDGDKHKFLLETLNAKTNDLIIKLTGPYNAFRIRYDIRMFDILAKQGLPFSIRFRGGYLYLEGVTGDLTQVFDTNTEAIMVRGAEGQERLIQDFKEEKNLPLAVKYFLGLDRNPKFIAMLKKVKAESESPVVTRKPWFRVFGRPDVSPNTPPLVEERKVHFYFSDSTEVDFTKWEFRGRNELVLKTDHSVVAVKGQDGIFVKPADYRENKGDTRESASGVRIPGGVEDVIKLDKGPADTNWWEQATMAELTKNPTPWGEDKIVPVDEQKGVIKIEITREMLKDYSEENPEGRNILQSFEKMAELGPKSIAGIRHIMNILNVHDTRQVKNSFERLLTTVSLGLMIKILYNKGENFPYMANYGHEVRYHSNTFQKITTRALAAMGFITHVVPNNKATAIWNTSTMGKFFNFVLSFCGTSSHSESEIDGLKIIDYEGSQFLIENIEAMIAIQKAIIDKIEKDGKFVFTLSSEDDPRITDKLYQLTNNGMFVYKQYQEKTTADEVVLGLIKAMDPAKIHIDCAHGAGYGTLTAFFKEIGISGVTDKIGWMHTEEKPDFGNIGKLMENPKNGKKEIFDLGADVTQVYEKVLPNGKVVKYFPVLCTADYPEKFAAMPIGDVVLHTDMDNDRLAVSQVLSNDVETRKLLERLGVVYNVINEEKLVAMFIPNKFFHFLHEINFNRITELMKEGTVDPNRKIVVLKTLASTPAVDKWAEARRNEGYNIEVVNTAVGFAKLANVMYRIEGDMRTAPGKDVIISDAAGKDINVGSNPIILAAWEESGGIIVGVIYGFKDILGNSFLSAREKSATESIFLSLALLSKLQQEMGNVDLSVYLDQLYTRDSTDTPIDIRFDNKLFTPGASKEAAEAEKAGNKRKDRIFGAFLSIVITYMRHELNLEEAKVVLRDIFNQEYEARKKLGEQAPVLTERYKNVDIDSLIDIQFTGDGVMFVFEKAGRKWFVLFRPSGTEPKNKSYGFGENPDTLTIDAWAFSFTENIAGALPGSFTSNKSLMNIWGTDGVKAIDKAQRMQVAWEKYGLVVDPTDPQDMKRLGVTKKDLKKRELVREFNPPDDHLKIIQDWLRQEGLGELDIDVSSNPAMPQEDIVALLKSIPEEVYEKLGRTKEEVLNKEEGGIISRQSASGIGIDTSWAPFARAMDNDTWKNMPAVIRTMAAKTGLWANFVDAGKVMLGWMTLSEWRKKDNIMPPMREFADQVRKEKAEGKTTDIVFVGQGGSVEAIKTLYGILGNDANSPKVHIMDTVDPEAVSDVKKLPLNTTRFVIISKSMTTMEVHSFYKLFYDLYVERNIPDSKNHFTLITDQGKAEVENGVLKVAEKVREPFRTEALSRGFLNVFYIEPCSGGRYSWDTAVGVLPALIMGQDVDQILEGARSIEERAKNMDLRENPMAQYGAFKYGMHMQGRNRPTLMLPSEVKPYGPWDGQLDTESLGKTSDQSSLTIDHEELAKDPRVYTNKRFFVRIKLGYQDFRLDAEVRNLERAGLPVYTITLLNSAPGNVSPKDLGALLKMSEFATVIAGHLMGETTEKINPVNQAGVEEYKKAQQVYIAEPYVENPKYVAVTENGNVKLDYRASVENKGKITQRMLNDVLKRLGRTDKNDVAARYAALLYLSARNMGRDYATMMIFKRLSLNPELGRILDEWRYGVRDTLMIDTLGEEAPCILHAKQQGFQKGEPSGNFTVVRFAKYNGEDIVIPGSEETYGQPKTFQDLIKAQAIGSLQALSNATETNAKGKEVNANRLGAMIELKDEKPETVAEFGKIVKESVALLSELVERDNRSKAIVEHMVAEEVSESSGKTHIYERSSASGRVAPTEAEVDLLTGVVKAPQSLSAMDISVVTDADIKALESTLLSLGTNKDALAKDGKVMIIWDTAISDNDNTNAAAQQTAKLIDERLGEGAAIHIRGNGENSAKLLAEVDRYLKSENVRAIVTIAGDKTLKAPAPIGGTVEEALQKLHEKSKVLNVQSKDTEGPLFIQVPALYNLALSIGYEMGEERIIQCLQSIGIVVDDNGKPIDPMSILTEKIVRILPKIRPVDMNADTLAQTLARKALETSL